MVADRAGVVGGGEGARGGGWQAAGEAVRQRDDGAGYGHHGHRGGGGGEDGAAGMEGTPGAAEGALDPGPGGSADREGQGDAGERAQRRRLAVEDAVEDDDRPVPDVDRVGDEPDEDDRAPGERASDRGRPRRRCSQISAAVPRQGGSAARPGKRRRAGRRARTGTRIAAAAAARSPRRPGGCAGRGGGAEGEGRAEAELPGAAVQEVEGGLLPAGQQRVLGKREGDEADADDGEERAAAAAAGDQRQDQREEDIELLLDREATRCAAAAPAGRRRRSSRCCVFQNRKFETKSVWRSPSAPARRRPGPERDETGGEGRRHHRDISAGRMRRARRS